VKSRWLDFSHRVDEEAKWKRIGVGVWIAFMRDERGMSNEEIGARLGIGRMAVRDRYRVHRRAKLKFLRSVPLLPVRALVESFARKRRPRRSSVK
jgi:hypothetical protein